MPQSIRSNFRTPSPLRGGLESRLSRRACPSFVTASRYAVAIGLFLACIGSTVDAEIPNKTPEKLQESASHIFTGKVLKIYSTVERSSTKSEMFHKVAEIAVEGVEKGEHEGRLAYLRFWSRRQLGNDPPQPGHYGHRGVPKVGTHARVYVMTEEDGGYNVLSPNGFAPIDPQK